VHTERTKVTFKTSVLEQVTHINPELIHLCIRGVMQFYQCGNFLKDEKLEDQKVKIWMGLANDYVRQ
jgi:hypothetical protein